jgi:hypothetical protein
VIPCQLWLRVGAGEPNKGKVIWGQRGAASCRTRFRRPQSYRKEFDRGDAASAG